MLAVLDGHESKAKVDAWWVDVCVCVFSQRMDTGCFGRGPYRVELDSVSKGGRGVKVMAGFAQLAPYKRGVHATCLSVAAGQFAMMQKDEIEAFVRAG